jgi:pimeloyl-ACP methyl ester carboxylesterase
MKNDRRSTLFRLARTGAALLLATFAVAADTTASRWDCGTVTDVESGTRGRVLIMPGVGNTRFHLAGFVERLEQQLPNFEIEVRTWGTPFHMIENLQAEERNVATAAEIAAELAAWRRIHPEEKLYVVGYSGGGGMVTLVTAALPDGVKIDRLVLVAPAISPDYPLAERVLPHVNELVANFASALDLQVGWGTRAFGTIDRKNTMSAGAVGFELTDPKLLQYVWSADDIPFGHFGNHMSYLNRRWQDAKLMPTLDPGSSLERVRARWAQTCKGT